MSNQRSTLNILSHLKRVAVTLIQLPLSQERAMLPALGLSQVKTISFTPGIIRKGVIATTVVWYRATRKAEQSTLLLISGGVQTLGLCD